MATVNSIFSRAIAPVAAGALASIALPFIPPVSNIAQADQQIAQAVQFTDVGGDYWARPFIESLAEQEIIAGFPDGSFKPNEPVTRAQFAAIVRQAFDQNRTRSAPNFVDVASSYWADEAIADAYGQGFLSGYPDGTFKPEQQIPRVQVIVSLANGLDVTADNPIDQVLDTYRDASQVPDYARDAVAAATENEMVVSYPDVNRLQPQRVATRADVAAFIYQALVSEGRMTELTDTVSASDYVVAYGAESPIPADSRTIPVGTPLAVRYPNADDIDIVVAPGQSIAMTLEVAQPVQNAAGQVLIPSGSLLQGRVEPVEIRGASVTAAQFVADNLTINNRTYAINAESSPIAATSSVSSASLEDALITTAAQSILTSIIGNSDLGALVGAVIGGNGQVTSESAVIVIDPNELDVMVESAFDVD